ncbi:MAG: MG2 domain-containing protein, partial [Planctomycetaceae bacterium]
MTARRLVPCLTGGTLLLAAALLLLRPGLSAENAEPDAATDAPKLVETETLGGAERYLTHLSTDKPIYRPGETLYLRGVVLHANTHKPLPQDQQVAAAVKVKGPKGDVVFSGYTRSEDSVFGLAWPVPQDQAGGEYTATVTYPGSGYPAAERKFDVRAYRAPRLKTQIVFVRDGYGPGDTVAASATVERAEGGVPVGAKVSVQARVDGRQVYDGTAVVDPAGYVSTRFELPKQIERGEGTLALIIEDGGVVETATKTIPILLQTVDLELY